MTVPLKKTRFLAGYTNRRAAESFCFLPWICHSPCGEAFLFSPRATPFAVRRSFSVFSQGYALRCAAKLCFAVELNKALAATPPLVNIRTMESGGIAAENF